MSVLIKGMEMPKGCASCFLKYGSCASIRKRMDVSKGDRWCPENYRHPDCPLIEVPPHGRLIDADEIREKFFCGEDVKHDEIHTTLDAVLYFIDGADTVIEADKDGET